MSKGLANVVEYAFQKSGRPNGYILGEDAGGAFIAGLRYGEGSSIPGMPAATGCTGRDRRSATTSAARAPRDGAGLQSAVTPRKSTTATPACRVRPIWSAASASSSRRTAM